MSNEFDAAVAATMQPDQGQAARVGFSVAADTNPDAYAEAQRVARRTGVPVDTVLNMPKEMKRQDTMGTIDFDALAKTAPATASLLSNIERAKVAHDNVESMTALEAQLNPRLAIGKIDGPAFQRYGVAAPVERSFLGNITEPVQRGLAQGRRGLTLLFDQMGIFKGLERQQAAAAAAHGISYDPSIELAVRLAQQQREVERYPVPDDIAQGMQDISNAQTMGDAFTAIRTNPRAVLETTLQSLGASAPALVGAAGGSVFGPGGTATGAGLGSFAVEYSNTLQDVMAEKGVNGTDSMSIRAALNNPELMAAAREKALKRGIPVAIFDALTAGLAGKLLAGAKPTVGSVGARAAGELGLQAGGGAAGEAGAQLATGEYKPGDILMEAFAEMPTAIIEVPGNYRHAMESAQRAQKGAEFIDNLNKLVQADKLVARDPQTFEQFVAQAAEAGPVQQVFIDAQTLMQSGVAQQVAAVSPAVASQLATAAQIGGQIAIPVEEYAARIAPTEYAQGLLDHLKTEPEGFSRAEAQQFMQSHAEELQAEVERTLAEKQVDDTFKASAEVVKAHLLADLNTLSRFTPAKNEADATLFASYFAVRAAQMGTTPEELFQRYPLKVVSESVASGQQLAQNGGMADKYTVAGTQAPTSAGDGSKAGANVIAEQTTDWAMVGKVSVGNNGRVTVYHMKGFAPGRSEKDGVVSSVMDAFRPALPEGQYWRFTNNKNELNLIKEGNLLRSKNHADNSEEAGLSVAEGAHYGIQGYKYGYIVSGNVIGRGSDGEPLLDVGKLQPVSKLMPVADIVSRDRAERAELLKSRGWTNAQIADIANGTFKLEAKQNEPPASAGSDVLNQGDYGSAMFLQGQPNAPRMMAVHNLSADNLIFADRMGGLAVPSVGVITEQAGWVDGFGEITLVGSKNLVDPESERVFSSDAYTARFPSPEWPKAKSKDAQALVDGIRAVATEFDERSIIDETWDNMTNTPDAGKVIDAWLRSNAIRATYLREQGVDVKPTMRNVSKSTPVPAERLAGLKPLWAPVEKLYWSLSRDELIETPEYQALAEAYRQIVTEAYQGKKRPDAMIARLAEFGPNDIEKLGNDLKNAGKQEVDTWETGKQLSEQIDTQAVAFKQWVEGKVLPKFGDPFIKVGGKKAPYTLRNIVEVMTDAKVKGKEKTMTYGAGQVRAAASVEFSDIEQMREHAAKQITNPAEYEAARAQAEKQLDAYRQAVVEFTKLRDWRGQADTWEALDASMRALAKWATGKKRDAKAMTAALKAEDFDTAKIPAEVIEQAMAAGNALMQAPVPYFEAKPQRAVSLDEFAGAVVPAGAPQVVLDTLAKHGIEVVEYSGEESRGEVARNLARNLSERGVATLFQNQQAPRGSFNPETFTITLLKGADLSTALHEGAHFFFENDLALAAELAQEAQMFGLDALKPGERQILADVSTLLNWHGIQGDIDTQLAQWYGLDFEEKRAYHERTAESFEAYLFEGKAPSLELQPYFQKFRAWLLNVYRSLKDFVARHPEAGKLNDEVRGVFDRLLATNEQITLAEQGRSMMPLFTSPEQAGMTPEEFAAYQALGVDATAQAIEDLQARGLRDMRWLHNARGRIIKQLQKDAEAQRAQVRMDVRREVMSRPIYRAWQFLTGKLTVDDKIAPPAKRTSSPDSIDETQDSLFAAIAKLGGLNRAAVQSEWGIDPKERIPMPAFGKHVLRREGGLSIDAMGEALGQYGYLTLDEHGKHDLRQLEDKFFEELRGNTQYSSAYDYAADMETRAGDQVVNPQALGAGRFDTGELRAMGLPTEVINAVQARRMTAGNGLHPDIVAEMFGFTSGDELVRKLAQVETPSAEIEALTDVRMLEQFGDLSSPEAIEKAADKAIHNDARARFVATEANALAKATGQRKVLASAAKEFARAMIARLKVRDIKPGQYANAEVRAAKAAEKASKSGDLATAAAEKRNQLIQNYATRAAYDAQENVDRGLRYLKKFEGDIKGLDADYADQIGNLLERFDLRKGQSNKAVDKRTALAEWIKAQREAGLEPDIPPELENEAFRTSYKNLTVEEFQGLVDTVRQIEHLGRLKHKLLTAADQRAYEAVRDEIAGSIRENAQGRQADTRTPTTNMGRAVQGLKRFWAAHIKAATWARVMDGGKDGGPMWEYFVRSANERGDQETTMRAEATAKLSEILAPVFKLGRMGGKGQFFPSINRSLNREARLAIALNTGNTGNLQRLLGGEGWTMAQLTPVLQSLTAQEWAAVQAVWDHFESYRPQIADKERRVYGKEPEWVAPQPFAVATADGATVTLRGGYYPIKYDPAASQRAEEHADAEGAKRQLQGAYTTATTRRSFTKARVEEVQGRPLLYTLAGMYSGVNDVIHDLAWHEWLIDANRLLRSHTIDAAIREHYGPEAKQQFKTWVQDVAEGDKGAANAGEMALGRLRQGVSASGLGFNVMSAAIQITGFNQSIVRVGAPWIGRGIAKYLGNPLGLTRTVHEMSDFMANRARTRFRELNELRNQVQDQSAFDEFIGRYAYFMMMRVQQVVDVPTWWGAYEKAIAAGNEETRAVALADQAVIDAQGSGQTKDLSTIERGGPALRLFTVFYSFMNTALNLGVAQTMGANTPAKRAKLAVDYLMLYTVPAVLGYTLKAALTPGDSGDDDLEEIAKKLAAEQLGYLMGLMVVVREFNEVAKMVTGNPSFGYSGPAGLRGITDVQKFGQQAMQGEFDDAFRKSAVNLIGDFTGLPAAQINRTITGTKALAEGKTENPAAVAFGFQEKR